MAMRTGIPTTAPNATAVGWTIAVGSKTIALGAARGTATGRSASAPWCFASCGVCRGEAMYVPAASASKTKSMAWSDGLHCKTSNPLSATVKFAGRKRAKRRYPRVQTVRVPRAPLPSSQSVYFMCNEQNK